MVQFLKRNAVRIGLTLMVIFTVSMTTVFVVTFVTAPRSDRSVTKISDSDSKMPEPGPGIGLNGKFNPNLLGTAPGL